MIPDYNQLSDEELAALLACGNNEATFLLLERYKQKALTLARILYNDYRNKINADVDDLCNCALTTVFTVAKSFSKKHANFSNYWRTCARRNLMKLIKESSDSYLSDNIYTFVSFDELGEERLAFAQSDVHQDTILDKLVDLVNTLKPEIGNQNVNIFIDYLYGMSREDIAPKYNLKYTTVLYRINSVRHKLKKFVIHS